MTTVERPVTLRWYAVPWVSGSVAGVRNIRAPNARTAEHDLGQNPSTYGIAHESIVVGRARCLELGHPRAAA